MTDELPKNPTRMLGILLQTSGHRHLSRLRFLRVTITVPTMLRPGNLVETVGSFFEVIKGKGACWSCFCLHTSCCAWRIVVWMQEIYLYILVGSDVRFGLFFADAVMLFTCISTKTYEVKPTSTKQPTLVGDFSFAKVQQKFGMSRDGRYLSLMLSPWLTREPKFCVGDGLKVWKTLEKCR